MSSGGYGVIWWTFFDGPTGRRIAELGGTDAQTVGIYLLSSEEATMLGLYPLDLLVMRSRIYSMTPKRIEEALIALELAEFAAYDDGTRVVWVREMAKYRLGLPKYGGGLDPKDNRIKRVNQLYAAVRPNPFLAPFYDRYAADLHLAPRRTFDGDRKALTEGLRRGSRGGGKPGTETGSGSETASAAATRPATGVSEQPDQEQRAVARDSRSSPNGTPAESFAVLVKCAHEVLSLFERGELRLRTGELARDDGDIDEALRQLAADRQILYDSVTTTKALASARHQRQRLDAARPLFRGSFRDRVQQARTRRQA